MVIRLDFTGVPRASILPKPLRFLESARTTAFLAGTLGTIVAGPLVGAKAFFGAGLTAGILKTSPKARKLLTQKILSPEKGGIFLGKVLEDPTRLIPKDKETFKEKVLSAGAQAGLLGLGTAAVIGGGALAVKAVKGKADVIRSLLPGKAPVLASPIAVAPALPDFRPIGVASQPTKEALPKAMPNIINKINVKPEINISFKKSNKFINQQVFMKR